MKEIGGYFNLELNDSGGFLHDDGILLNSCRNALKLVLISRNPSRIWLPKYTCESVFQPIISLKLDYATYSIDENFEIKDVDLKDGDVLLYTNYFGIKETYIKKLAKLYSDILIIDNAQSLYSEPIKGISTIYSPRKFVGVPDGGIAYLKESNIQCNYPIDKSFNRCSHLLRRYDESASSGYLDFRSNDDDLENREILLMSNLTNALLRNIDFEIIRTKRWSNFNYLHDKIGKLNKFEIDLKSISCPLIYPFYSENRNLRKALIENSIYVATYWPNVIKNNGNYEIENKLAQNILPLPIDQRYDHKEIKKIISIIEQYHE